MLLTIDNVLSSAELASVRVAYAEARFGDGRVTAGELAAQVKNNLQLPEASPAAQRLSALVLQALQRNSLFVAAALPRAISQVLFNRYVPGMEFGMHIDNAIRFGATTLRTDVSATLFISEPQDYAGGELCIDDSVGTQQIKLPAGSLVLYPSGSLHRVNPVTAGMREVAVFWVQSMVRSDAQRTELYTLDRIIQSLRMRAAESPEIVSLTGCYHNLLRMWAEL